MMRRGILLAAAFLAAGGGAQAAVTKFEIQSRKPFPSDARFELLEGHFTGALDPVDPHNAIINDIQLAPRDSNGRVVYSATFKLLKPLDMTSASGLLIYDVPNRGHGTVTAFPQGHVSVISGWQGDLADDGALQTITVPVAHNRDGSPILGPVIARFMDMPAGTTTLAIAGGPAGGIGGHNFLPATDKGARLIKASSDTAQAVEVPRNDWAFGDCTSAAFPGKPDLGKLCLKNGFDPKFAYTLSFLAQGPRLLSVGFAATRDLIAFLRYAKSDEAGNPNPVAGQMRWAIGRGVSQSGNYLRSFLHLGFNAAESGRIVFDGVNPLIAARQNPMNFRFANPGGAANLYEPGSDGVVWWARYADRTRGLREASLLDRCNATATCPKIVEELGSSEFWGLRASPDFVGTDAKADLPLPANVRRYYTPGVTHGGGRGGFALTSGVAAGCILPANPNPAIDTYNAIFDALIQWVTHDVPPPPSSYPTLAAGDLVAPTAAAMGFPTIPERPSPDGHLNMLLQYDFGPNFHAADLSGAISLQPPHVVRALPSLVPRTDADGNEIAGIRSVLMQAPLGTYLGWNVTAKGFEAGRGCGFQGGYIPFAATKAERLANKDPRPSLEERYGTHANYVARVKAAADKLVSERYLLPQDADRIIHEAENSSLLGQ
ncbi:MAG TPA: alpha/beta hydrolase domain-containing protein [Rhizomicrobium sp.]|nr:alpha/beta hydrolase domain-containing protein [Rhizomicrobium sp.]